jgi:hypothetical protein
MFNKVTSRSYGYFFMFSYFFLVEKWIPPSRSETAEIGQKNRRNFRGLKTCKLLNLWDKFAKEQ